MIKVEMNYNKKNLKMKILMNVKFEGGFKSKNFNKNFLILVLKYAHIARRSRYR